MKADLADAFRKDTWRLLRRGAFSAIAIPVIILALFSLTAFRFTPSQYVAFSLSLAAVVIPYVIVLGLLYFNMQRRLLRSLIVWYERERDPDNEGDRALAVRLQRSLSLSSFKHGALVGAGIFLSIATSVLAFGRLAGFDLYTSICYIALGAIMGLVDFLVTVFISYREMRTTMAHFLADCRGFEYYAAPGIGKRLAAFALVMLVLTIGTTWIASSYESSDLLKREMVRRGSDNVSLLAVRLDALLEKGADRARLEEAVAALSLAEDERIAVIDSRGTVEFEYQAGTIDDVAWRELIAKMRAGGEGAACSGFEQSGRQDYLLTCAPLAAEPGWKVVRADLPEIHLRALGRQSPTMLVILVLGLIVAAYLTILMTHNITDPIKRLVAICRTVGTGDLSVEVPVDSLDDTGELSSSYSDMIASLRRMSSDVLDTSGDLNEGAENIVAASEEIMASIEELNALVQDLSGQIEREVDRIADVEMAVISVRDTISSSHAQANKSYEISHDAEMVVQEGRDSAREAVSKIGDFKDMLDESMEAILSLGESSEQISVIVDIISRIADQTNLLALNAAIEAARVPEHGKGFAVVAGEVKKLAEEVASSASRISDLVRVIQDDVAVAKGLMERGTMGMYVGMETVERTDQSLASIAAIVSRMAELVDGISEASSLEISEGEMLAESLHKMKEQVVSNAGSYEEISASTEQQTVVTTELASTASRLSEIAHHLHDMVAHFKISRDD